MHNNKNTFVKSDLINMTRAWDKEKKYESSTENEHRAGALSTELR